MKIIKYTIENSTIGVELEKNTYLDKFSRNIANLLKAQIRAGRIGTTIEKIYFIKEEDSKNEPFITYGDEYIPNKKYQILTPSEEKKEILINKLEELCKPNQQ